MILATTEAKIVAKAKGKATKNVVGKARGKKIVAASVKSKPVRVNPTRKSRMEG